jgi:hypothetical protein
MIRRPGPEVRSALRFRSPYARSSGSCCKCPHGRAGKLSNSHSQPAALAPTRHPRTSTREKCERDGVFARSPGPTGGLSLAIRCTFQDSFPLIGLLQLGFSCASVQQTPWENFKNRDRARRPRRARVRVSQARATQSTSPQGERQRIERGKYRGFRLQNRW